MNAYDPRLLTIVDEAITEILGDVKQKGDIIHLVAKKIGIAAIPEEAYIDISKIKWQNKDKQPAKPDDSWAWAFAFDRDGKVLNETRELLGELEKNDGKVVVGEYEVTLGGRDGNLLNRKLRK